MKVKCKVELLESLYRAEVINSAKERDVLYEKIDELSAKESDLIDEVSYLRYENQRLRKQIEPIIKDCKVPKILKKPLAATSSELEDKTNA